MRDGRLQLGKIFRKKIDGELIEVVERFAGKICVQQNDIAPILFGHVAVGGDEAVDAAVVAVSDDSTFDFGVIREAVAEAETVAGGERRLRIFHAGNGFGLEELFVGCGAAAEKELDELGEFGGRSFHVACGAEIDFLVGDRLDGFTVGALVTLRK